LEKYARLAKEFGADGAKVIRTQDIFVRDWVFLKCKFGCEGFGRRLTCPPRSPSPEQTRRVVAEYGYALLVHFVREPGRHKKPDVTGIAARIERAIFLDGRYKAWAMGCGPCRICKKCGPGECRHAREARPSMEACGVDVYATARGAGFPIEVVSDYDQQSNRYALVLIE
jgi:predicted metal-binding protein